MVEKSRKMLRHGSHSSSIAGSGTAASPKGRLSFFKKKAGSRDESGNSEKIYDPPPSDKIVSSPFSLPDLEVTSSDGNMPSPDSFIIATHDTEFLLLKENIRRLRKAPHAADPKKLDASWEVYKRVREESLQTCKSLLQRSQNTKRNTSLDLTDIGPLDTRSSYSSPLSESAPSHVADQWLTAIQEYKSLQEGMLENIETSLLTTFRAYERNAPERQLERFLADKTFRQNLIIKWRDTSVHRMKSEKHLFWEQYNIRFYNFDKLRSDLQRMEKLLDLASDVESPNAAVREYVIARNGDAIFEFANAASETHPILRFRVNSHLLAEASPFFSEILSSRQQGYEPPLDMIADLPPPPKMEAFKDGTEVKVYQMPQFELNQNESLTILLHAAHMNKQRVPRKIEFPVFVSIAEVCLRYRCTSPIELQVEYQWLPQWMNVSGEDYWDGLLLISYAFGDQKLFKKMSRMSILTIIEDAEIEAKTQWPIVVKEKIKAVRNAKLAQIQACCTNAIEEYFRPPPDAIAHRSSVGSLTLTTVPRCPRGSHLCDATNLGWLMLVYNELRVLPNIMTNGGFHDRPQSPKRSVKELVDCLRLMPSAPQVHNGVCDTTPAFRSAVNDIYNSVVGLTLHDVSGRIGWALSKDAATTNDRYDGIPTEPHEMPTTENAEFGNGPPPMSSNETVCFQILSNLDDIKDLNSAAMIDKGFYRVYKRNEAALLKNVVRAERRRTMSTMDGSGPLRPTISISPALPAPERPSSATILDQRLDDDLYDVSTPSSPISQEDISMSTEEANRILWPDDVFREVQAYSTEGSPVERNEKYLIGEVSHIEDKTIVEDANKHLRDEKDQALGLGLHKSER